MQFKLHIPDVASHEPGEEALDSLFPHTPRLAEACYNNAPPESLVIECLRPGICSAEGADGEWMKKMLVRLGHAANERGDVLLSHSWFQCAYAAAGSLTELLSSINMRRKLGQWHLCQALYAHVESLELTAAQREVSERWHAWVNERLGSSSEPPPERLTATEELSELRAAPAATAGLLSPEEQQRLVQLLRSSGHAANHGKDFEAAHTWFDCAFALTGSPLDLLSAANMRGRLAQVRTELLPFPRAPSTSLPLSTHMPPPSAPHPPSPTCWCCADELGGDAGVRARTLARGVPREAAGDGAGEADENQGAARGRGPAGSVGRHGERKPGQRFPPRLFLSSVLTRKHGARRRTAVS